MRCDTVLAYADENCVLYSSFMLSAKLVANPVNETAMQSSENKKQYIRTDLTILTVLKDGEHEKNH